MDKTQIEPSLSYRLHALFLLFGSCVHEEFVFFGAGIGRVRQKGVVFFMVCSLAFMEISAKWSIFKP
jgi:hypothetical protein